MVAMVLGNADIPSGQGAPPANATQGGTSNLAVMGITGFVTTQENDRLAQLAQTVPDLSKALEAGTVDKDMFKKVLEQLRANEAQKLTQGLTQVSQKAYGAHWLILLMSVRGIPCCDTRLLQLKQGVAGPPESLGKSAARIPPEGTPRTNPGRARPGNAV